MQLPPKLVLGTIRHPSSPPKELASEAFGVTGSIRELQWKMFAY